MEGDNEQASTAPFVRLLADVPSIRVIVIVPATLLGCQTMSKVEFGPDLRVTPCFGSVITSKCSVWATADETRPRRATDTAEKSITNSI